MANTVELEKEAFLRSTVRSADRNVHAVDGLCRQQLARLAKDPDGPLMANLHRPVKLGHTAQVVEAELAFLNGKVRVAYKRYCKRNLWKAFCGLFRRSRAWKSWRKGQALAERNIPSARPLAVHECRGLGRLGATYLATEWIEDSENLHLFGWRIADKPMPERLRLAARCAESLGSLLGRMHAAGIEHGDLKGANILVSIRDGELSTYLIDFDDVRIRKRLGRRQRLSDLSRLATGLWAHPWVGRTIFCRFFRAYAAQFPPGEIEWKQLWREVAEKSRRYIERRVRRGKDVL